MEQKLKCLRCHHQWTKRIPSLIPVACPRCKSYSWNTTKTTTKLEQEAKNDE